jgi:hypothetical protein
MNSATKAGSGGSNFTDTFADGNAVHTYRIDTDSSCLPSPSRALHGRPVRPTADGENDSCT